MDYNTEAFLAYSTKPKWRNILYSVALVYVWGWGLFFSASNNSTAYATVFCALFSGCMAVLVLEYAECAETAKKINNEARHLEGQLNWLRTRCVALENENNELIKKLN